MITVMEKQLRHIQIVSIILVYWKCHYYNYTAPSSPPENVTVTSIDGVSLSVAWELPSEIHQNGRIISYEIIYRMYYCELDKIFDEETVTVNATLTQYIISGLTPFVGYVVKIAARNVNGSGVFFEATQVSEKDSECT